MKLDYIYQSPGNFEKPLTALIVLPEIFGITDFISQTTDKFAKELNMPSYALDFFYQLNHISNKFDYEADMQKGIELMQQMRGEDFLTIFNNAIEKITSASPSIENIIVCGFCFGGRLAYLSGLNDKVKKIISFYGAGANMPSYLEDKSCIGALSDKRSNDSGLSILSFYGGVDDSIPIEDREKTKSLLGESGINYHEVVYSDAGHAFFNNHRAKMYNELASNKSWEEIVEFVK